MKYYKAHWEILLVILSAFLTLICLTIALIALIQDAPFWTGLLLLALIILCALFTIRGYTITPDAIWVHRLVWVTRIPRAGLQSARFEPQAMRWSIRLFGNGGFFSYSGIYRNKILGTYRAYVTDRESTVVLRYIGRTVVLSPAAPEEFVREILSTHAC